MSEAGIVVVSFDDLVDRIDVLTQSTIDKGKTRAVLLAWLKRMAVRDKAKVTTVQNVAIIDEIDPDTWPESTTADGHRDEIGIWVDEDGRLVVKAQNGKIVPLEEYYSRALE